MREWAVKSLSADSAGREVLPAGQAYDSQAGGSGNSASLEVTGTTSRDIAPQVRYFTAC